MIQRDYKLVKNNFVVIDGKKELNHEILLQSFKDFCLNNNMNVDKNNHHFNRNDLAVALCYEASHNHFIWNIKVYETLGLNRENILRNDEINEQINTKCIRFQCHYNFKFIYKQRISINC